MLSIVTIEKSYLLTHAFTSTPPSFHLSGLSHPVIPISQIMRVPAPYPSKEEEKGAEEDEEESIKSNQIESNQIGSLFQNLYAVRSFRLSIIRKKPPPQWKIEVSSSTRLDSIRVERKTLQNLLDDCQRALQLLNLSDVDDSDRVGQWSDSPDREEELSTSESRDPETDKVRVSPSFTSPPRPSCCSWDVVSEDDILWGDKSMEDDYVVVREEDVADGIACFMVTYLSSLEQTKDISPDQLQKALSTMFSVKKRKGKLRKAWEGSKVIYNVASWSATAIGIYQNPMILSIASKAFWVSCKAISKLV
ncbi:PREDICTED: uncharacterized protein LOC106309600 isoform X2 [Brassica oleracea var. oleracea]|uniref:uncharacterized protein LOC106309600 isoform X2 n=1 Tax=Brassica oleracea var. oleracea TaxID=109376 RepID=UPI0006A7407D|nr:PREDICTED: uncharacterized protein LOC106309600 isoform X2 [Brassica oleracea var. oleracea]